VRVRSPDIRRCAQLGGFPPSVACRPAEGQYGAPLDRASVSSPVIPPIGPGSERRGRLTPRNNRPDYRGSCPLASAASGVERPPRTWAEWRGGDPSPQTNAPTLREICDFRQAQVQSASIAAWHENDQRVGSVPPACPLSVIDELGDSLQTVTLLATKLRRSPSAGSARVGSRRPAHRRRRERGQGGSRRSHVGPEAGRSADVRRSSAERRRCRSDSAGRGHRFAARGCRDQGGGMQLYSRHAQSSSSLTVRSSGLPSTGSYSKGARPIQSRLEQRRVLRAFSWLSRSRARATAASRRRSSQSVGGGGGKTTPRLEASAPLQRAASRAANKG
jgi:hypothetical protein